MTEELAPISYQGLGNMIRSLWGGGANYYPLHDKPVESVAIDQDGEHLVFRLVDGRTLTYEAVGDCCSSSWVEHITVPPDLAGSVFDAVAETNMGEKVDDKDWETIRFYQTSFRCPKGEVIVEYRNSSNGYYGGWLEGPLESWARAELND